jgi:hypothetical protein
MFDMRCQEKRDRLTKIKHPWTNVRSRKQPSNATTTTDTISSKLTFLAAGTAGTASTVSEFLSKVMTARSRFRR